MGSDVLGGSSVEFGGAREFALGLGEHGGAIEPIDHIWKLVAKAGADLLGLLEAALVDEIENGVGEVIKAIVVDVDDRGSEVEEVGK